MIDSGFIRKDDLSNNARSTNKDTDDITSSKHYEELYRTINELQYNMRSMTNKFQSEIDQCRNQTTFELKLHLNIAGKICLRW